MPRKKPTEHRTATKGPAPVVETAPQEGPSQAVSDDIGVTSPNTAPKLQEAQRQLTETARRLEALEDRSRPAAPAPAGKIAETLFGMSIEATGDGRYFLQAPDGQRLNAAPATREELADAIVVLAVHQHVQRETEPEHMNGTGALTGAPRERSGVNSGG